MNQHNLHWLVLCLQLIVYLYLTATALYILFFALASIFPYRQKKITPSKKMRRFAILIPCYREDEVILDVVLHALRNPYPAFKLVVIADNFSGQTIEQLRRLPIVLFNEKFEISTKTRALNHALRNLPEDEYDCVVILDADNLMDNAYLFHINTSFDNGYLAIQGHRVAKNLNTPFAVLDAVSEEINNQIFRKGHRVVGLSSALIGSAMAFDYPYFKNLMSEIEVVGGFDKELELKLMLNKQKIEYLPDALVYDEKVQNIKVFTRQRRRWLSAQFHYFGIYFKPAIQKLITEGNLDFFNKAMQYVQLPRILLTGSLLIFSLLSLFINPFWISICWISSLLAAIVSLLVSIPRKYYTTQTAQALIYLPVGFIFMIISLLKMKGANKNFIHTKHTFNAFQIKKKH